MKSTKKTESTKTERIVLAVAASYIIGRLAVGLILNI